MTTTNFAEFCDSEKISNCDFPDRYYDITSV